jgi:hypothetical protein
LSKDHTSLLDSAGLNRQIVANERVVR